MTDRGKRSFALGFIAVLGLITAYRVWAVATWDLPLFSDEAYYFGWSQSLDFGYYSKPPMVAWMIRLTTWICGDAEICIRLGPMFAYALTAWVLFILTERLFDGRTAFFSALAFLTLPIVANRSFFATTDAPLLLYWSLALYFLLRALQEDRLGLWLAAGLTGGLGMLSKYSMAIFVLSGLSYLALTPAHRHHLSNWKLYAAVLLAALVFVPNIVWNYAHDIASFEHTVTIAQLDRRLFHPGKMLYFVVGQLIAFGPVLMGTLLVIFWRARPIAADDRYRILLAFTVPFLGVITVLSLLSRAFLNWAFPAYAAGTVLVVAYLLQRRRGGVLVAALVVNIAIGIPVYHYHKIAPLLGVELKRSTDPYARHLGWPEVAAQLRPVMDRFPGTKLMGDNRNVLAELVYYLRPHAPAPAIWNPTGKVTDHYRLTAGAGSMPGEDFIFVTESTGDEELNGRFDSVQLIDEIVVPVYADLVRRFRVYRLVGFRGYEP